MMVNSLMQLVTTLIRRLIEDKLDDSQQMQKVTLEKFIVSQTTDDTQSFDVVIMIVINCLPAALRAVEDYERFKKLLKHICSIRLRRLVTFCF